MSQSNGSGSGAEIEAIVPSLPTSMLHVPVGIHADISPSLYYKKELGVASKSALDYVLKSPATYRAWVDGSLTDKSSESLSFGTALHCAALEPDVYARDYVVEPDFGDCRRADNKARRDVWRSENERKRAMPVSDGMAIDGMLRVLRTHPLVARILFEGQTEVTLRWDDPGTGLACKGRSDWWIERHGMVVDLKTTDDASPNAFARSVANYGYMRQAAMYLDGFSCAGAVPKHFLFVAIEKKQPYLTAVYTLDTRDVERGRAQNRRALETLAGCLATDKWPGLPEQVQMLKLPRWYGE